MKTFMQVSVPAVVYGSGRYYVPDPIGIWLEEYSLQYEFIGTNMSGVGASSLEDVYLIRNISIEDASAFKIQFPECTIHIHNTETTN